MLSDKLAKAINKMYKQHDIIPPRFAVGEYVYLPGGEYAKVIAFDYEGNVLVQLWGGVERREVKQDDLQSN